MTTQRSTLELIINTMRKGKGIEQTTKETEKLDKTQKQTKKSTDLFNIALGSMATTALGLAAAFASQIPELLEINFKYRNAKIALEAYAGSAFEAQQITDAVTRATSGAIDQMTATQNATKLFSLGLADNAEQAEKLTKIAVTLGATMGRDAKGAFEDFTLLLANQSILRLDTFGISGAKVRERMEELAKTMPELDRQTRFLNATMEIAGEKMVKLEAAGFEATSSMDRLRAEVTNLKLDMAQTVSDGLEPLLDSLFEIVDASRDQVGAAYDAAESWGEYKELLGDANRVGGLFVKNTRFTNEELFNQAKASEALAAEMDTLGGEIEEVVDIEAELAKETERNNKLLAIIRVSMRGLITEGVEKLAKAEAELAEITDTNSEEWLTAKDTVDELRESLKKTTAELIFQQAAAGLDADASLELAGALGLLDEATFAVAKRAQDLRNKYDEGALSAHGFSQETVILRDAVSRLESKDITINAQTLQAEIDLLRVERRIDDIPRDKTVFMSIFAKLLPSIGPFEGRFQPFQEGGTLSIPDRGPLGDRHPVGVLLERGEELNITPRGGDAPPGGKGVNIGTVNVGDEVGLVLFMDMLENYAHG